MTMFMAVVGGWGAASVALGLVVAAMIRQEERLTCRPAPSAPPGRPGPAPVVAGAGTSGSGHQEAVTVC